MNTGRFTKQKNLPALRIVFLRQEHDPNPQAGGFRHYQSPAVPNHTSLTAFNYRYALTYLAAFCVSGLTAPVAAAYSASEQANLNVILRQLNTLEDTAYRSAQLIEEPGKRYSFDYQRLTDDIARIRNGLKDYLSPNRSQPRDLVELSGNYTTEGRQP